MRRIGVLLPAAADDAAYQAASRHSCRGLQQLGWIDGRNVRIEPAGPRAMPPTFANTRRN